MYYSFNKFHEGVISMTDAILLAERLEKLGKFAYGLMKRNCTNITKLRRVENAQGRLSSNGVSATPI